MYMHPFSGGSAQSFHVSWANVGARNKNLIIFNIKKYSHIISLSSITLRFSLGSSIGGSG